MGGNTRTGALAQWAAVVDERRARVASYKVRGFSIRQTQAALTKDGHLNPRTQKPWSIKVIDEDLQFLTARWQAEAKRDISEHIARELERLDELEREAWAAWHRGIGQKRQTVTERRKGGNAAGDKASVRTEELNGDPRYLAVIIDCQKRRADLLGLNAPRRSEITGKDGGPVEVSDARERLAARLTALLARGGEGGAPGESQPTGS